MSRRRSDQSDGTVEFGGANETVVHDELAPTKSKPVPITPPSVKYRIKFKGGTSQLVDEGCAAVYRQRPGVESIKLVRIKE